jgi:putative FmdB family regulatory protein
MYDYRCKTCGHEFTETHGFDESAFDCPECESEDIQRIITGAPTFARGMLTPAGTSRKSSKEELRAKWKEETSKLRKKLRDKLGEGAVQDIPSLNQDND